MASTRISVVTVVRNSRATIVDCIQSVRRQSLPAEHIVVDGESTDGTLELLQTCAKDGTIIISEADRGMYDAMSKGIRRAHADIIGILNADDYYTDPDVLNSVAELFQDPALDTCYADLVYVSVPASANDDRLGHLELAGSKFVLKGERVVRYWRAGNPKASGFYFGWMPPHPTFFVRRAVYERFGLFRLDLGTAADYELMLRYLVKHQITTRYLPEVLVKMRVGGASNASLTNRIAAHRNDRKAWAVNGLRPYPWTLWLKPLRKLGQWR